MNSPAFHFLPGPEDILITLFFTVASQQSSRFARFRASEMALLVSRPFSRILACMSHFWTFRTFAVGVIYKLPRFLPLSLVVDNRMGIRIF